MYVYQGTEDIVENLQEQRKYRKFNFEVIVEYFNLTMQKENVITNLTFCSLMYGNHF